MKDTELYNLKFECDRKMKKYEDLKNELTEKNQKIENLTNQLAEKNLKIADYEKSVAAQSEENLKLSETVRLLTDEILNRVGRAEQWRITNGKTKSGALLGKRKLGLPLTA